MSISTYNVLIRTIYIICLYLYIHIMYTYPVVSNSRVHNQSGSATMGAYDIRRICAAYVTAYAFFLRSWHRLSQTILRFIWKTIDFRLGLFNPSLHMPHMSRICAPHMSYAAYVICRICAAYAKCTQLLTTTG